MITVTAYEKMLFTVKYVKSEECVGAKKAYGVSVWKYTRNLWDEFFDSLKLKDGNRRKVKMLTDRWLDDIPLEEQFTDLYEICTNKSCTVADCYST